MSKKQLTIIFLILSLMYFQPAAAGIRSIVDWGGENAQTDNAGFFLDSTSSAPSFNNDIDNSYCQNACPGYTLSPVCPDGMEARSCLQNDCSAYKRCEGTPCQEGFDTKVKACDIDIQIDNYFCSKCKE